MLTYPNLKSRLALLKLQLCSSLAFSNELWLETVTYIQDWVVVKCWQLPLEAMGLTVVEVGVVHASPLISAQIC